MLRIERAPGAVTQSAGSDPAAACKLTDSKIGILLLSVRGWLLRQASERGHNKLDSNYELNYRLSHDDETPFLMFQPSKLH
jgi:hypothetical protein